MSDNVWAAGGGPAGGRAGEGQPVSGFAPLTALGKLVIGMQWVQLGLLVGMTGLDLLYFAVDPHGFADPSGETGTALGLSLAVLVGLAGVGTIGVTLIGAPFWIWWHWRAGANLQALGIRHEYGPGGNAGWWFVPFANLVMPYRAMSELYASTAHGPDGDYRVADSFPLWWGCWLVSNFLTNISFRLSLQGEMYGAALGLDTISTPLSVVATLLYVGYVRQISAGQDQLAAAAARA